MDFIELSPREVADIYAELKYADAHGGIRKLRVSLDEGGVKFKINELMWSPPLGQKGEPY